MYQIGEDFWRKITPWTEEPDQPQSSLVPQTVKTSLAMWETCVQSLGGEDPLEKGTATYSSILACRIPWTEDPGRLQSMESQTDSHKLSDFHFQAILHGVTKESYTTE